MFHGRVLFILAVVIFAGILLTQVIIPVMKGTPVFPIFRPKWRRAHTKLSEAKESHEVAEINKEANTLREQDTAPGVQRNSARQKRR